jgi:hypothetical protein
MVLQSRLGDTRLLDIEKHILSGHAETALRQLNETGLQDADIREREYLIGRAHAELKNFKAAVDHYLRSAFDRNPYFPSLFSAAELLASGGYKREAIFLRDKARRLAERLGGFDESFAGRERALDAQINANTVVAIHQPAYLPWLGFFHKIFYSDRFVILEDAEFSKNSFIKRTLINKTQVNEGLYLTIPAAKHSDYIVIDEMVESTAEDWRAAHIRKIYGSYSGTKYFREFYPRIREAVESTRGIASIARINAALLDSLLNLLNLRREICSSREFAIPVKDPHERNMLMCRALGGNVYFSGSAAINYQQGKACPPGMRLIYQRIWDHLEINPYLPSNQFTNGLSILDALFTVGPDRIFDIFESYNDPGRGHCFG